MSSKGSAPRSEILALLAPATATQSDPPTPTELLTGTDDAHFLGYSVSYAGDVNGDGIDDVIVGALKKSLDDVHHQVGAAFVIFGQTDGLPDIESVDHLDGTNGFALYGNVINDDVGYAVSYAGDLNGDGFDDVIIGAPGVDGEGVPGSGQAYVVFGTDAGFQAVYNAWDLDGSTGFIIQGNSIQDYLGSSVSYAGDVNDDGIDDVIVGAPGADNGGRYNGGEAYVIFGSTSGFPSLLFITDLDGSNGFAIESEGEQDEQFLGQSVGFAGDVNGDGIGDILVGATGALNVNGVRTGATYVIYGDSAGFDASFQVSTLTGANGFKISSTAENDQFGRSVSALGDVNGDGIHDFIVGCPRCRPTGGEFYAGAAYVFYGSVDQASSVDAATAGMIVAANDAFDGLGESVSFAGDVNGDGIADILIGSGRGNAANHAIVYVIYGSTTDLTPSIAASDIDGSSDGIAISMFDSSFAGKTDRIISVAFAGDFNNDGTSDLIVGLPEVELADETLEGQVMMLLGK